MRVTLEKNAQRFLSRHKTPKRAYYEIESMEAKHASRFCGIRKGGFRELPNRAVGTRRRVRAHGNFRRGCLKGRGQAVDKVIAAQADNRKTGKGGLMVDNAEQAIRAVASYVRMHSHVFVQAGPTMLTREKSAERQSHIEQIADQLDELANTAGRAVVSYRELETFLAELRQLGATPPGELVSHVARALYVHPN
ncbi:hypothetical protein G3O00_40785 [Burkholderia sp. Ac-20384]|nr:hypothetical protein [Burkholderia sp. Ac-20384]MBN3829864.1 hypothetical protein [Burkholderia sp. Ac-20384]